MGDGDMSEKVKDNKLVVLLLITGAVYFFLKVIAPLTAPILVAMLFVTIFGPLLQKMQAKLKVNRQIGAVLLLLLACSILGLLIWVLFSWIVGSLPAWVGNLDSLEIQLGEIIHNICNFAGKIPGIDSMYLEEMIVTQIQDGFDYFQEQFLPGVLSQSLEYAKVIAAVGAFLITFLIATVLLAKDYDKIMNNLLEREDCHVLLEVICGIIRYIATFVKAQAVIMGTIGVIVACVLGIAGVKHGVLWGVLAGFLDALPFVGTGIVLVPLTVQQLFLGNYGQAVVCMITYAVCIFLREMLEPRLIGKRVGVPPIAILLAIYAGVQLFGVWGIVAGPLGFVIIYYTYMSLERRIKKSLNIGEQQGQVDSEQGE